MRAVVQRVSEAEVAVGDEVISRIGQGILVLLGMEKGDGEAERQYLVRKMANLRIFGDADGKMNLSVKDVGGEILVVSQFTLSADCRKGNRPSFDRSESPEHAETMYLKVVEDLRKLGITTRTGRFGASMSVRLVNAGPVTFIIDTPARHEG